ncbi:MAG: alpha/beta fold hydrolase [Chlamydiota bacterium]
MPLQTVNGIQLYYEVKGTGKPLLFLSGFSSHHRGWDPFVEVFSPFRQTIALDNRGAGQSSAPSFPYTIDMLATDVISLLDFLSIPQVDIMGSSMGTAIALTLALCYPKRIGKGVLISPFAKLPDTALLKLRSLGRLLQANTPFDLVVETALPWLFSRHFLSRSDWIEAKKTELVNNPYPQPLDGYFGQLAALESFDLRSQLSNIKTPFLLIAGEEDLSTPLHCADLLAANLPKAKLCTVPEVGHMVHVEKKAQVISWALSFLS